MKKKILLILLICFIIFIVLFTYLKKVQSKKIDIENFNLFYENYNKDNLNGLDITTVINKAINNNEQYGIEKNENGEYISDNENCIKIYITMIINGKTYPMERISNLGMSSFIEYFGNVSFKCSNISYHEKNGKVSSITFEANEY